MKLICDLDQFCLYLRSVLKLHLFVYFSSSVCGGHTRHSLYDLVLSSHHVAPWDQTQTIRFSSKSLQLLYHPTSTRPLLLTAMFTFSSFLGDLFFFFLQLPGCLFISGIDFTSLYLFSILTTNNHELNSLKITQIYHIISPGVRMVEMGLRRLKPRGQLSCIPFGDSGENAFPGLFQWPLVTSILFPHGHFSCHKAHHSNLCLSYFSLAPLPSPMDPDDSTGPTWRIQDHFPTSPS